MSENDPELSTGDLVDVTVPPVETDDVSEFEHEGSFDLVGFVGYAQERSGSVGGIGVALDTLDARSDDLEQFAQAGATPGELELHAETVQDVVTILQNVAASELSSYDSPVYEVEDGVTDSSKETANDDGQIAQISEKNLAKVKLDRISGSGNIIAEPVGPGPDHIHVKNGVIGDTMIAYHPRGKLANKSGPDKPFALPYESKNEAQELYSPNTPIPLNEGQYVQLFETEINNRTITSNDFEVDEFVVESDVPDGATVLLQIQNVQQGKAKAEIQEITKFRSGNRGDSTAKVPNHSITQISGGPIGSKNDLISNKKL
jgi:hypothetical protein